MRLTALILLSACLAASATGHSQKITISEKAAPMEKVFSLIEKQTGYSFYYKVELLAKTKPVDISIKDGTLDQVLTLIFNGQPLSYNIIANNIVVKEKPAVAVPVLTDNGQLTTDNLPIDISGRVTDEDNNPLAGATIAVRGTKQVTKTDASGVFVLKRVEEDAILEVSNAEFLSVIVKVDNRTSIMIVLKRSETSLNEVILNKGYYTTSQKLNTGDVTKITAKEIEKQPVSNPLQALQGRVPGMIISQNTGVPGGSFSVQIRGLNSISFSSDPLYIIDGVPYLSQLLPNVGTGITSKIGTSGGNPLNYINPSDIESIDILKDADATAIYGSRGANGVVLITTKKGKAGKTVLDANVYLGTGKVAKMMDLLNRDQYLEMRHESLKNDNVNPTAVDRDLNGDWDSTRYTDWQKEIIGGIAHYSNAQLSISGGSNNTKYLLSGTYHKESTVFPSSFNDKKAAFHFNVTSTSIDQRFNLLFSGMFMNDISQLPKADLTPFIWGSPVTPKLYNDDGTLNWQYNATGVLTFANPLAQLTRKYKNQTNNIVGNLNLSYQVIPGLDLKTSLGYNNLMVEEINTQPIAALPPNFPVSQKIGSANFVNNSSHGWIIEPQATYKIQLGKGQLNSLIGTTIQQNNNRGQVITGSKYTSDLTLEDIKSAPATTVSSSVNSQYKYNALFGRLNYNWQQQYILNATMRRDGSSRFGPDRQFHDFFAVGAAWLFSNESFIKQNLPFLSFGKLRASYGTTGNDQIGDYQFLDLYGTTPSYQGGQGYYPLNLFNPELAWEETKKKEGGIELGFLNDQILISASYYQNLSNNQLLLASVPYTTGFSYITTNLPALVENTGFELSLSSKNIEYKKFIWKTNFNLTVSRNKLKEFPNFIGSGYDFKYVIGQPLSVVKLYHFERVDPTTGIYQFGDGKGGLTTRPDTATLATTYSSINITPKFYGGFQNSFQAGNFEIDVFFQFVKQMGQQFLVNPNFTPPGRFGIQNNQPVTVLQRWQKQGQETDISKYSQRASSEIATGYTLMQKSDLSYGDASFIRFKNLSVSYKVPTNWVSKAHLQNARIYFQAQNLFTITKYKGLDPETQSVNNLPLLRVLTLGLQITL